MQTKKWRKENTVGGCMTFWREGNNKEHTDIWSGKDGERFQQYFKLTGNQFAQVSFLVGKDLVKHSWCLCHMHWSDSFSHTACSCEPKMAWKNHDYTNIIFFSFLARISHAACRIPRNGIPSLTRHDFCRKPLKRHLVSEMWTHEPLWAGSSTQPSALMAQMLEMLASWAGGHGVSHSYIVWHTSTGQLLTVYLVNVNILWSHHHLLWVLHCCVPFTASQ